MLAKEILERAFLSLYHESVTDFCIIVSLSGSACVHFLKRSFEDAVASVQLAGYILLRK